MALTSIQKKFSKKRIPDILRNIIRTPITPQTLPKTVFEQIATPTQKKFLRNIETAVVAPAFELTQLAEQVGVPLAKGEGIKGIDVLGRDRSILEFPKAKETLAKISKAGAKIAPAAIPGLGILGTPISSAIEKAPEEPFAEAGRLGAKLIAAGGIRAGARGIAKREVGRQAQTIKDFAKRETLRINPQADAAKVEAFSDAFTREVITGKRVPPRALVKELGFLGRGGGVPIGKGKVPTKRGDIVKPPEIVLPDIIKRFAVRRPEHIGGESLFHETSPEQAFNLIGVGQNAAGLNVSNDPEFALGQKGQGVLIEMDKASTFGEKGFARIITKPGTEFVGEKEFEIGAGQIGKIKSVTIKPNIKVPVILKRYLNRFFDISKQPDGSFMATPKVSQKPPVPPTQPPALPPIGEPDIPPAQKVVNALKKAKPLRKEQETIFTKERSERLAKSLKAGEITKGEAGFFAEKAQLKGELTKVQFESIRKDLTPDDIDNLYIQVKDSPSINEWDKLAAREGLLKVLGETGGTVPTKNQIQLLNKVFGSEFTKAISDKQSLFEKFKNAGLQLANIPRTIMASFDLSAPMRQGLFLVSRKKQFLPAFGRMFKAFGSERYFRELGNQITTDPTFPMAQDSGLSLTELDAGLTQREEEFQSQWAEKIPLVGLGVRASGRAYTGFLNKLRFDVFKDLVNKSQVAGLDPQNNRDLTTSMATFINAATGRGKLPGGLENAAVGLNAFFFSPRLLASRISLLNPNFYIRLDPFVRKEALKSLLSLLGIGLTIMTLAKMAGAKVEEDSRSSDFGKIKIGNTRIDIWGGFQQYIVLAARLMRSSVKSATTGKITKLGEGFRPLTRLDIASRFLEFKQAPVFSFVTDLLRGRTALGEEIKVSAEVRKRFTPMVIADMVEIAKDNPALFPVSMLGIFGTGIQTFKRRKRKVSRKRRPLTSVQRKFS